MPGIRSDNKHNKNLVSVIKELITQAVGGKAVGGIEHKLPVTTDKGPAFGNGFYIRTNVLSR